jgi:uncharacterized membrane protein
MGDSNGSAAGGKDSKARSLVKAISWRMVAFIVLSIISYAITGSARETGLIALVYNVVQIGIYFAHERLWDRIRWGKPNGVDVLPHASQLSPAEMQAVVDRLAELGYIEK